MTDPWNFAEGQDLDDFLADRQLRYAIERALEIIGEATSNLSDEVKNRDPSLPWSEMLGLRNIVAHACHRVEPVRVWQVVTRDLRRRQEKIRDVLKEVQEEEGP